MIPRLLLFAGPNGSGKSTITTPETLAYYQIPPERYINADDIARLLSETHPDLIQLDRERDAFRRARALRQSYYTDGLSFAFETVFSHPSTLLDMQRCHTAGFEVVVLFVTTEKPEINVGRVAGRYQAGGHDVPVERIHARYHRVMALLPRIVEDADRATVFDNSALPLRVFSFRQGVSLPSRDTLPDYLRNALIVPLAARQAERAALVATFDSLLPPNESAGIYSGPPLQIGEHYVVQQCEKGAIRHDRLLLEKTQGVIPGQTITIRYKDAVGAISL